jgi:diguanylate cyclase (GGDEF)-like protein/PAS domain S-box-containing protein
VRSGRRSVDGGVVMRARRLGAQAWITAVGGIAVVAVVMVALVGLHSRSGQQEAAFRTVTTLRTAVSLEQEGLFDPDRQTAADQVAAGEALTQVQATSIPDAARTSITQLSTVYQASITRELVPLMSGDVQEATRLDTTVGDPAFAALDRELAAVVGDLAKSSDQAVTDGFVASAALVVGVSLTIFLFAFFARRRRLRLVIVEANALRLADVARITAEGEESFRSLFDENPQSMFVWNPEGFGSGERRGQFLSVNKAALELYGYTRDEFLLLSPSDLRAEPARGRLRADLVAITGGREHLTDVQHCTKSGEVLEVELDVRDTTFDGSAAKLMCTRDVTERLRLQGELEHQAFHDGLTGLPNRSLFSDRLEHAHTRLQRRPGRYAVLMLDLDNFKTVNDSLGHGAGDELLVAVAARLTDTMRPGDTTARLGGDEFAILLEDLSDETAATAAANRLREALLAPFSVAGRVLTVTATVGLASPAGADVPSDVMRNADVALYVGKAGGKNRHEVFSEHMHATAMERLTLEQDLREGIGRGELLLHYQPKVDARTGRLRGVEALVRWNHPSRGMVRPDAFIPLAEQTGLIADIDQWVLRAACRQARAWSTSATGPIPVAVNVSGKDLVATRLLGQVQEILQQTALDPSLLELEITESAAIPHDADTLHILQRIRDLGVRIAIDDFGTGFSVLSRLQGFPLDTLKIDLSFVRAITQAGDEAPIVDAMIAMGRSLGLVVIAEGVETRVQRDYLTNHGCSQLQGYLFSKPIGADELAAWAKARTPSAVALRIVA